MGIEGNSEQRSREFSETRAIRTDFRNPKRVVVRIALEEFAKKPFLRANDALQPMHGFATLPVFEVFHGGCREWAGD
jgi:hypothetical protein